MIANPTLFIGKKLVDQYNNFYHCSIDTKPINAGYSALNEKSRPILKFQNLKLTELELLSIRIFLVKVILKKLVKRNIYY